MIFVDDNSLKKSIGDLKNQELRNYATAGITVSLKDFIEKPQFQFLSFINNEEKRALKSSAEDLVFNCYGENADYFVDTGNYIGKILWKVGKKHFDVEIGSRFSSIFLQRMMNSANDIYWDDFDDTKSEESKDNTAQFILHYLFVQALEKAYLLGLPRTYQSVEHHESSVKGRIDINKFIRQDIPFKGKVSSISREQLEIPEIVDVLYKAVSIATKSENNTLKSRVNHIVPHLKQARTTHYVSSQTIYKAKTSKALDNPMFSSYKIVLNLAEMVINQQGLREREDANEQGFGFLINVAELFEIYITKLLQKEFPDWDVSSPKLTVYEKTFFKRKIIPDIVMEKKNSNDIMVFDTKYKRMNFTGRRASSMGDVDRNDFFQIHTYMSYYLPTHNVLAVGLLYPLSGEYKKEECVSEEALGDQKTLFVIDGIELKDLETGFKDYNVLMSDLILKEQRFIRRVKDMIKQGLEKRNR